jgi:hypothetical protein
MLQNIERHQGIKEINKKKLIEEGLRRILEIERKTGINNEMRKQIMLTLGDHILDKGLSLDVGPKEKQIIMMKAEAR